MKLALLFLLAIGGVIGRVVDTQTRVQIPMAVDEADTYHIGMDLSASHGAVAVAFSNNETTIPIARVEGSDEYKSLLAELSRQEKWEPDAPWIPVDPRHTAILSKMIIELKKSAEERLGVVINSTLAATPPLPYLYEKTVHASLLQAGLKDMDHTHVSFGGSFKQPQAVMAGWGIGMCHKWWDRPNCTKEAGDWPRENPITVLYTSNALCVSRSDSKGIYGHIDIYSYPSSMDFTLGYSERDHNPDESFYWEAVRQRIIKGALGSSAFLPRNPTVWVHGDRDAASNEKFRQVLEKAINDILPDEPPIYYPDDPEFLAARGAATVVRRGQYKGY